MRAASTALPNAGHKKSGTICEVCGHAGVRAKSGNWWLTLCEGHRDARDAQRKLRLAESHLEYFAKLGEKLMGGEGHVVNLVEVYETVGDRKVLKERVGIDTKQLQHAYLAWKALKE